MVKQPEKHPPLPSEKEAARTQVLSGDQSPGPCQEQNHGHPARGRTLYWLSKPTSFGQEIFRKLHIHRGVQRREAAAGKPLASMAIYEIRSDDDH